MSDSGGDGEGEPPVPPVFAREALLRSVKRQQARDQYTWSLPTAVVSYVLFAASLILHAQVEGAYELESGLLSTVSGTAEAGGSLQSAANVYAYLQGGILATAFAGDGSGSGGGSDGTINRYSTILGGVRLGQRRSPSVACPFQGVFHAYGRACYPTGSESLAPFGNRSLTDELGLSGAFTPGDSAELDPFQLVLPAGASPAQVAAAASGLEAAGWIDIATKQVNVEVSVFNLDVGAWARVFIGFTLTRGGRIDRSILVESVPIDPYFSQPALRAFDVLNLLYLLLLLGQNGVNGYRAARKVLHLRRDGQAWRAALGAVDLWLAVDIGASVSLLLTASLWAATVAALSKLSAAVSRQGIFSDPAALGGDTSSVQSLLDGALTGYWDFKRAAVATLVFLTLRLFWQFSLQPRLAVMTESLSRAAPDMAHFGFLFGVIMASYCVWGHVMFGPQLADWRSLPDSAFAVVRFAMYDYDFPAMASVDAAAASAFYGSFMFLITNMLLWMFLAIVMETYSAVRLEVAGAPSALADLVEGTLALPAKARALAAALAEASARPPHAIDLDRVVEEEAEEAPGGGGSGGGAVEAAAGGGSSSGGGGAGADAFSLEVLDGRGSGDRAAGGATAAGARAAASGSATFKGGGHVAGARAAHAVSLRALEEALASRPLCPRARVSAQEIAIVLRTSVHDVAAALARVAEISSAAPF